MALSNNIIAPFTFWKGNPVLVNKSSDKFDSVVVVSPDISSLNYPKSYFLSDHLDALKAQKQGDAAFESTVTFLLPQVKQCENLKKLVYSPTGPLNRDYDDVRRYTDAAVKGLKRILCAGAKCPLLAVLDHQTLFSYRDIAALLGAAEVIYVPFEIRKDVPSKCTKVDVLGFTSFDLVNALVEFTDKHNILSAIEMGRILCRDIGGSDPECMAAPYVAFYVQEMFKNTPIKVEVIEDEAVIQKEYPLLAAVNRGARGIKRHCARVIHLTYLPDGAYDTTLALVGKGITYDTGGADIKYGGHMAGMHRDKCGAAAVAGFFMTLAHMKPKGIKVLGSMAMARNSVGADCYVSDEIVTSRAGARVRIGNTDAEGRMVMADVLCHMKEKVMNEKNPYIFTVATLTGHAVLSVGEGYSIVMDNGPSKFEKVGLSLQEAGDAYGDMFEVSTLRREDYEFHKGKSEYEDLLQCNNKPSSQTERGHQTPAAFLIMASGLDKHGIDSDQPLKYCHIDIAGSSGPFPGIPSGAPIAALTKRFLER